MRIPALLVVLAAALAVAGCETTIDESKAESTIEKSVTAQVGATVQSVECPKDVKAKAGGSFTCTVTGEDGSSGAANVKMTDDDGHVEVSAPFIHVRELEQSIAASLAEQVAVDPEQVTVSCPEIIVAKKGGKLQCDGTGEGEPFTLDVTQTDDKGNVDYKVVES